MKTNENSIGWNCTGIRVTSRKQQDGLEKLFQKLGYTGHLTSDAEYGDPTSFYPFFILYDTWFSADNRENYAKVVFDSFEEYWQNKLGLDKPQSVKVTLSDFPNRGVSVCAIMFKRGEFTIDGGTYPCTAIQKLADAWASLQ